MSIKTPAGVVIIGPVAPQHAEILTPGALDFVATLQRLFNGRRKELLAKREQRQKDIDARGPAALGFLPETAHIRNDHHWKGPIPAPGLVDRRVEITGPLDRKMIINALNSGASTFMADNEDSHAPTFTNNLDGQINLRDAVRSEISYKAPGPNGKSYKLKPGKLATLIVRPRGWHMEEAHMLVDGEPMSGSLFDFGLYFFHNGVESVKRGFGPYFYLPKMESHLEARLWNDVFNVAQDWVGMPRGTIRGTVLIETITAAFEMDEIIYELREHSAGLNCGRWDYIFSYIKKFRNHPSLVLPDRSEISMTTPFMDAYVRLLIKTCHKRGVHAMGGMAAIIPIKTDKAANDAAMAKVRADKLREVQAGHDGTWVAHPDLVKIARDIFDKHMPQANQIHVRREDVSVSAEDLTALKGVNQKNITENGLRMNIDVGLQYMEAWLRGVGCVPIHNLMEDAATAEISRSQIWQWVKNGCFTKEGKKIDAAFVKQVLDEDLAARRKALGEKYSKTKFDLAAKLFSSTILGGDYALFLTTLCYPAIVTPVSAAKM